MDESIVGKKCSCCPVPLDIYPSYYIIQGGHYDHDVSLDHGELQNLRQCRRYGESDGLPRTKCQSCGHTYTRFWAANDPDWASHIRWVVIDTKTGQVIEQMPPSLYVATKTDSRADHAGTGG